MFPEIYEEPVVFSHPLAVLCWWSIL
jgi:hypothetical protein